MRAFATVLMFLACLISGTVSAWAGRQMCFTMEAPVSLQNSPHDQPDLSGMAKNEMAMVGISMGHSVKAEPDKRACASSEGAHMPFCPGCVALTPEAAMNDG